MARRRRRTIANPGQVPAPFLDPAADVWHDQRATVDLARQLGLTMAPRQDGALGIRSLCALRRGALVTAWARQYGYTNRYGQPDHSRLAALGITGLRTYPMREDYECPHGQPNM